MLIHPEINPVALQLGPLAIHWYGLTYLAAFGLFFFLASLRLQARQGHRGLYVALPTQATGNAMFERTLTFLRAFADGRALDIQLAHGGALLNDSVARLRNVWGEDGKREAVRSAAWFAQRRRGLGVDLGDAEPRLELPGGLLVGRRHHAAGTAPGRPEVDDHRNGVGGFDHIGHEAGVAAVDAG